MFNSIYKSSFDVDFLCKQEKMEAVTTFHLAGAAVRRAGSLQRRSGSRKFVVTLGDHDVFRERRRFRLEWELAIFP